MRIFAQKPGFTHDFSRISPGKRSPVTIQTKLRINTPGDSYEREADRVAEKVMSMNEPKLHRACACGGGCPRCASENTGHGQLQTKRMQENESEGMAAPPIVNEVLNSSGQPLDPATRDFMGSRFGHDFSHVRVHTDERAAASSQAVNARAYTVGSHIMFNSGEFAPERAEGRHLLAHELTHVLQQGQNSRPGRVLRRQAPGGPSTDLSVDDGNETELNALLIDIAERTADNLQLRQEMDALPQTSSEQRETLSKTLNDGRTELIGLLQRRIILLTIAIPDLKSNLSSKIRVSDPGESVAAKVFLKVGRYEKQLKEHEAALMGLERWQMRRRIGSIDAEVSMIDDELKGLPPVSDPNDPQSDLLAARRAELLEQRATLVKSLTSNAVEYKQFDERWGATRYGSSKDCTNIKTGGCGPTSLAILLNYLYSEDPESLTPGAIEFVTPDETAAYAATHGRVCNDGTIADTMVTQVATQWPGYRGKSINLTQATSELRNGNLVIFSCHDCTGKNAAGKNQTYERHILVLSGVDAEGETFTALDPGRREATNIETISRKELTDHTGGFWIVEKK